VKGRFGFVGNRSDDSENERHFGDRMRAARGYGREGGAGLSHLGKVRKELRFGEG
jgi:hypothetical protein